MTTSKPRETNLLASAATVALIAGAAGTVTLFLASARNTPAVLIFLFTGWVLLPYVALAFGRRRQAQRPAAAGAVMNVATLFIVGSATAVYAATAVMPTAPRRAAVFLLVPLACQLLASAAYAIAATRGRVPSSDGQR